jgi:hypothetical protein
VRLGGGAGEVTEDGKVNVIKVFGKCIVCGEQSEVEFDDSVDDQEGFVAWMRGELVQVAFAHWTEPKRELLISGTHPQCWEVLHLPEPDDD